MFRKQTIDRMSQLTKKVENILPGIEKGPGLNKDLSVLSPVG